MRLRLQRWLMTKRSIPFRQGGLDALCGVYAVVNALCYLQRSINNDEAEDIFIDILIELEDSKELLNRIVDGTGRREIHYLMDYLNTEHNIHWYKPFNRITKLTLNQVWHSMKTFLEQPKRGVILALIIEEGIHWSLVRKMSDKKIYLYDSENIKTIYRKRCSITYHNPKRPNVVHPLNLYYLTLKS